MVDRTRVCNASSQAEDADARGADRIRRALPLGGGCPEVIPDFLAKGDLASAGSSNTRTKIGAHSAAAFNFQTTEGYVLW